jgi:ribosomal protein L37AE/L43A
MEDQKPKADKSGKTTMVIWTCRKCDRKVSLPVGSKPEIKGCNEIKGSGGEPPGRFSHLWEKDKIKGHHQHDPVISEVNWTCRKCGKRTGLADIEIPDWSGCNEVAGSEGRPPGAFFHEWLGIHT